MSEMDVSPESSTVTAIRYWKERAAAAEAQLTALQAEQAQWQQDKETWVRTAEKLAAQLSAALTAQQDGSLPTRQPKP